MDEIVVHLYYDGGHSILEKDVKTALQRVLFADVRMGKVTRPLAVATSLTSASLLKIYRNETGLLSLPELE